MKKCRIHTRFTVLFLLIASICMVTGGCTAKKIRQKSDISREEWRTTWIKDSILSEIRKESVRLEQVKWQEIIFSMPDTTGRQHVEQVRTAISTAGNMDWENSVGEQRTWLHTGNRSETKQVETVNTTNKKQLFPTILIVGIIIIPVIISFISFKKTIH